MYCAVIKGPSLSQIKVQMEAVEFHADLLEIRWDLFDSVDYSISSKLPMIFTLRPKSQGGNYGESESKRLNSIKKLLVHQPAYLDIEYFVPGSFTQECKNIFPSLKIIRSYHDFDKTPEDLESLVKSMQDPFVDFYKIAGTAKSMNDSLRILNFLKHAPKNILGICMGEKGVLTRLLAKPWTYCSIDENSLTAPGQLSLQTLKAHSQTFYGLIGDPIETSISDVTHNALMQHFESPSLYLKMSVKPNELEDFLKYIRKLPFQGLSVTMPLKEAIIPHLDTIHPKAKKIGAVNTLVIQDAKLHGFNTDGIGALQAIHAKMDIKGKTAVVLGAGGVARAIIYELQQAGAQVIILNRKKDRAEILAKEFGCLKGNSLDAMAVYAKQGYDLIINCTPIMPISQEHILEGCYVMETKTKPKMTSFLQAAQERNCTLIYGYEMFVNQATGQFSLWTLWDSQEVSAILTDHSRTTLECCDLSNPSQTS